MTLKVTQGDNGGYGYGFVYFNDDTRVGYAVGATEDGVGPYGMFPGNWGGNTDEHFRLAGEWLKENVSLEI